jgi:hypothetical protein
MENLLYTCIALTYIALQIAIPKACLADLRWSACVRLQHGTLFVFCLCQIQILQSLFLVASNTLTDPLLNFHIFHRR